PYVRLLQRHLPHADFHFWPGTKTIAPRGQWDAFFAEHLVPFDSLLPAPDEERENRLTGLDLSLLMTGVGGNNLVSLEARASGYLDHLAASGRWLAWRREACGHSRIYGTARARMLRQAFLKP